jgi:hypothetical protein
MTVVAFGAKSVPVRVTVMPPAGGPNAGATLVIVGGASVSWAIAVPQSQGSVADAAYSPATHTWVGSVGSSAAAE